MQCIARTTRTHAAFLHMTSMLDMLFDGKSGIFNCRISFSIEVHEHMHVVHITFSIECRKKNTHFI